MMQLVSDHAPVLGVAASCSALGVSRASYYRSRRPAPPAPRVRTIARKLPSEQRRAVLDILHSPRFVDMAPAEVHATLLDEGQYLCSVRSMYRILAENREVRERRNQLRHPSYAAPELLATRPNELWSWDIERHEALSDRAMVRDHRGSAVAAAGYKRRAARAGERQ